MVRKAVFKVFPELCINILHDRGTFVDELLSAQTHQSWNIIQSCSSKFHLIPLLVLRQGCFIRLVFLKTILHILRAAAPTAVRGLLSGIGSTGYIICSLLLIYARRAPRNKNVSERQAGATQLFD